MIVDTYALMAKATGEISNEADKWLEEIRRGRSKGMIHPMITYEFLLQFHRKRIPVFRDVDEALTFLETYFDVMKLDNQVVSVAAEIKSKSRDLVTRLRRHLSICDSVTIAIAREEGYPILTGDEDLQAIAIRENVKVIW